MCITRICTLLASRGKSGLHGWQICQVEPRSARVPVSVEGGKLDLASRIESKTSAWTVEALADLLDVSPKTLYKMAKSGRIPVIRIGGMLRFNPVHRADWLQARTVGTALRLAGQTRGRQD